MCEKGKSLYMNKIVIASISALVVCAPVFAADFSGPAIEAHVGWDRPGIKISDFAGSVKGHESGFIYGGGLGYDVRQGNLVFGALAAIDGSNVKDCVTAGANQGCLEAGRDIEAGARIGTVVGSHTLLYGKVAYANSQLRAAYRDTAANSSDHLNRDGLRFGAGLEFALNAHSYVKAEYRYTTYKAYHVSLFGDDVRLKLDRNQALFGAGYRF